MFSFLLELPSHKVAVFSHLRSYLAVFQSSCAILHLYQQFSASSPAHYCLAVILAILVGVKWYFAAVFPSH